MERVVLVKEEEITARYIELWKIFFIEVVELHVEACVTSALLSRLESNLKSDLEVGVLLQ